MKSKSLIDIIRDTTLKVVEPLIPTWRMATVTGITPVRIRMDGETSPLPATPRVFVTGLAIGDRVEVRRLGTTYAITGKGGGAGGDSTPVGTLTAYAGGTTPTGWLLCNGTTFSPTTYPALFTTIGTTYGGTAQAPRLPNLRDAFPMGAGSTARGSTGGEAQHVLTGAEMPAHSHSGFTVNGQTLKWGRVARTSDATAATTLSTNAHNLGDATFTTGSTGSGQAHNNLPPYLAVNYIIKAQ